MTEAGLKYFFKQSALAELDSILVELATSSKVELMKNCHSKAVLFSKRFGFSMVQVLTLIKDCWLL